MRGRLFLIAIGLCLLLPSSAAAYVDFHCQGTDACAFASADGSHLVFDTTDRLLPGDDSTTNDVYELINGKTLRLLTPDPPNEPPPNRGSIVKGLSRDGERVVIETQHAYSPQDQDVFQDTYVLEDGAWTLVTVSPGHEWFPFIGLSADARYVYFNPFRTPLVSNDLDNDSDIYEWSRQGGVRMVSTGPTESTTPMPSYLGYEVNFGGATDDGSRVAFTSGDALTADASSNPNDAANVYFRDNGSATTFVPVPGTLPDPWTPRTSVGDISPDGRLLYINTSLQVDPNDADLGTDVYVRHENGAFTWISRGPTGGNGSVESCGGEVYWACSAGFLGASRSGDRVFFGTDERLVPEDTDASSDIYERFGSTTTLITPGTPDVQGSMRLLWAPQFEGVSADGTEVAFSTRAPLVAADKDDRLDIYVRAEGRLDLVSTGPAGENSKYEPRFADFIEGGGNVIFFSKAPLVEEDTDNDVDVYERVLFNKTTKGASAAGKKRKKAKSRGKTKLISKERIAPRMRLSRRGRVSGGTAQVRIGCPKQETSGGCKGSAKAVGAGGGGFSVKRGRSTWVSVGSASAVGGSATVIVRGKDLFGNKAKLRKRVRF